MFINKVKPDGFFSSKEQYAALSGDEDMQHIFEISSDRHIELIDEISKGRSMSFENGEIITVVAKNETPPEDMRQYLIQDADRTLQPMLSYAVAGILSDAEKETFKAWNKYRKALEDVDVTATDIEWPAKPA